MEQRWEVVRKEEPKVGRFKEARCSIDPSPGWTQQAGSRKTIYRRKPHRPFRGTQTTHKDVVIDWWTSRHSWYACRWEKKTHASKPLLRSGPSPRQRVDLQPRQFSSTRERGLPEFSIPSRQTEIKSFCTTFEHSIHWLSGYCEEEDIFCVSGLARHSKDAERERTIEDSYTE